MPLPGRAAILMLAALGLAACDSKKTLTAEYIAADKTISGPAPGQIFNLATPDAKVSLVMPGQAANYPEMQRALFDEEKQHLLDFAQTAKEDRKRLAQTGKRQPQPYERRETWTITAVTPNLLSLRANWFADTGGAHPNHGSEVKLWDREHSQFILPAELFKPDADLGAQDRLLCAAVTKARVARMGANPPGQWSCPRWADSRFVLVPSARPYRIGGLMFLFDPYVIGAYAEGDYEAPIPLSDFQKILSPTWAPEFSGAPASTVKSHK
jgi:hypothetical protein